MADVTQTQIADAWWETLGIDDTMVVDPGATILPESSPRAAVDVLERLVGDEGDGLRAELRFHSTDVSSAHPYAKTTLHPHADLETEGSTLGVGGMGIVRLATQRTLGRKVAVKGLKEKFTGNERAVMGLVTEAWVTGALEHPNIVPVYALGLDERGAPLIVLKRIEGRTWAELIRDPEAVRDRFGASDVLEWHLQILQQVCNGVHFAHSRGIVHRDLKPENVMIGSFGEVYVLDWGIAVSLEDDGSGRFPLAAQARGCAGTPCYMAPEMVAPVASAVTQVTDVYQLGAILHEILMGEPPHTGTSLREILQKAQRSEPVDYPQDVPVELAELCNLAMHREPFERIPTADFFRQALLEYATHRQSAEISRSAQEPLMLLRALLPREGASSDRKEGALPQTICEEGLDEAAYVEAQGLLSACRFGFGQALKTWPENYVAKEGLHEAHTLVFELDLLHRNLHGATKTLALMSAPTSKMRERLESLRVQLAEVATEERALIEAGRNMDRSVGSRTRSFAAVFFGLVWSLMPLLSKIMGSQDNSHGTAVVVVACMLLVLCIFGLWARETLMRTHFNRRVSLGVTMVFVAELFLFWGAHRHGIDVPTTLVFTVFLWFVAAAMFTLLLDWRLFPTPLIYLAGFLIVAGDTEIWPLVASLCNLMVGISVYLAWRPPEWGLVPLKRRRGQSSK